MLQEVHEALESRDLVLVLVDATRRIQVGSEPSEFLSTTRRELGAGQELKNAHGWASEDEFLFSLVASLTALFSWC